MRNQILGALLTLAGSLAAQSSTLPKGWDAKDGTDDYGAGTTNAQFWVGFDLGATYNPAKGQFSYDASQFPWDPTKAYVIKKLSFRRDGGDATVTATAHKRKWVVIMSTNDHHPAQANFNHYAGNHGKNQTVVFGALGTPGDVSFPASAKPTTAGAPAAFDVSIDLKGAGFVVPANSKTLVIEIRSYDVSGATSGWWRSDAVRHDGANYDGGSFSLINTDHCVSPSIFYTARTATIGSNFGHIWRQRQSPGGKQVLTWLGFKNPTPFLFPGSPKCKVQVFPPLAVRGDVSEKSGDYAVYIDWGKIPLDAAFIGATASHQSMFVDSTYPGGVGLSRGATTKVGSGYDPKLCPSSALYSYGTLSTRYAGAVDPDKEPYARYFYRRSVVMKIN